MLKHMVDNMCNLNVNILKIPVNDKLPFLLVKENDDGSNHIEGYFDIENDAKILIFNEQKCLTRGQCSTFLLINLDHMVEYNKDDVKNKYNHNHYDCYVVTYNNIKTYKLL